MITLIDSHCHLDADEFAPDRDEVLKRARASGVATLVVPGVTAAAWPRIRSLAASHGIHAAYGLHPMFLEQHRKEHLSRLEQWLVAEKPVAIGECGLDFFVPGLDQGVQIDYLVAQLQLARELDLPVILHARRSVDTVTKHLRHYPGLTGVVHSFSGSLQQATKLFELGFRLGIGGAVTHERARRLRAVVAALPAEALLLETDSPDQPGRGHRGERNEPAYLVEVLETVANLRRVDPETLARTCNRNAAALFGITL